MLFLSLNLPGPRKAVPEASRLFAWGFERVAETFPGSVLLAHDLDALGQFALRALDHDPQAAKRLCVRLEEAHPAARLLDLDIYSPTAGQIGRRVLGLPSRPCLLCRQPAVDCMRARRHGSTPVISAAHALLAQFHS